MLCRNYNGDNESRRFACAFWNRLDFGEASLFIYIDLRPFSSVFLCVKLYWSFCFSWRFFLKCAVFFLPRSTMNKSVLTNVIALALLLAAMRRQINTCCTGLFAFSQFAASPTGLRFTYLLKKCQRAVLVLFQHALKSSKAAIKQLMMEQFFTEINIKPLPQQWDDWKIAQSRAVIKEIDFNPAFDSRSCYRELTVWRHVSDGWWHRSPTADEKAPL